MKLWPLFLLLLLGRGIAGPIPFDPDRGLVEIPVILDGRVHGTFGIDTGADRLYIDRTFVETNNLSITGSLSSYEVAGVDGISQAAAISLRSLRIGDEESLYNLPATAVDFQTLSKSPDGTHPDGLIGHDILRRFYVTVDYPGRTIELESFDPDFLTGNKYWEIPFVQHQHLILVEVAFDDDVTATMILDYCASHTTLSPRLAEQLGLDPDDRSRQYVSSMTLGEKVTSEDVMVYVTDMSVFRKSVPRAQFEGVIGASFLYQYKITVDYKRQRIYVHKS